MKVEIKEKIAKALRKRVNESKEFKNIEGYVNYVLEQVVERLKEESCGKEEKKEVYSKEEEKKVKERLRSLGYLD